MKKTLLVLCLLTPTANFAQKIIKDFKFQMTDYDTVSSHKASYLAYRIDDKENICKVYTSIKIPGIAATDKNINEMQKESAITKQDATTGFLVVYTVPQF